MLVVTRAFKDARAGSRHGACGALCTRARKRLVGLRTAGAPGLTGAVCADTTCVHVVHSGDSAYTNETSVNMFGSGFSIKGNAITYLITATDFLNCLVFLLAMLVFKLRLNATVKVIQKKQVTVADFSVFVKRLPESTWVVARRGGWLGARAPGSRTGTRVGTGSWGGARCLCGCYVCVRQPSARVVACAGAHCPSHASLGALRGLVRETRRVGPMRTALLVFVSARCRSPWACALRWPSSAANEKAIANHFNNLFRLDYDGVEVMRKLLIKRANDAKQ